ncbi:MAG: adenylate/guanylate cyclase domain-containing protein [Crocinitomicaceae bacterium]|nr:adenylate/guanylate cyclase domain-containing protein [Crocinitomicaceae bacterium]
MIRHGLFVAFLLLVLNVQAQTGYRFKNLTINDGLSQSSVTAIVQDKLNALWIGTQDGLNRYDGRTFENFTSDETEGLQSEFITCALKDKTGNLWFGTSNGLTHYNLHTESFQTFKPKEDVAFFINGITEDSNGNLWIASAEFGVYKFDKKTESFTSLEDVIPAKNTLNIVAFDGGKLVVSTDDGKVLIYDPKQKKVTAVVIPLKTTKSLSVNKIVLYSDTKAILATNQGAFEVNLLNGKTNTMFKQLDDQEGLQNISDVYQQEGIGWLICTNNNGLFVITEKEKIIHNTEDIFQKTALLFNELNIVYRDASGIFWIGSQRGLSSFNPARKGIMGIGPSGIGHSGIPTSSVWSFSEDQEGDYLFIGTDRAVTKLNKSTGKYEQFQRVQEETSNGTGEMAVLCIEVISPNKQLVGCADGLYELTQTNGAHIYKKVVYTREGGKSHNRIYSIVHWKEDLYWIATKDGVLLYSSSAHAIVNAFEHDSSLPEETISKGICRLVFKDLNGRVWFSTSTGGLNILSESDGKIVIRPYEHNYIIKSTSTDYITCIHQQKKGEYWFGTSGSGLMRWVERSKKVEVFNKTNGLPNDVIYGIQSTEDGSLWLSTNKGLSNFHPASGIVKNYTEMDGLMSNEFNLGAHMQSSTGDLYFGGIYGFNYFDPSELLSEEKNIDVVFTRFRLENEWLTPTSEGSPLTEPIFQTSQISLSYKQRSFTIKFQSSDLSNPELVNYKYLLEGSDEGEVFIGTMNEIHFSALSNGEYTLRVYARYGEGPWSMVPATLQFEIAAPFWLRWWFWLIALVIMAISVRIFIRVRVEAARRDQVKLEIKIRDRTREIKEQNKKIESQKKKIEEERNKVIRQQELLQIEKDKSEKLLRNIIPESTAEELKKSGKARARAYKTVSVLFTDFVGFTQISERMTATELVKKLDVYFTKFDEIIVKNNLEKIKTIGDAYMCAGGVPVRNNTNPIDACIAALQIQAYMIKRKNDAIANGREYWELRLGINTGEVTAGVIGSERLAYDIWGATVNQAQRMEMLGAPEKVTITGATFKHIEPYFECSFIGKAQSKSRGLIDMYVVERIKPELSLKGEGVHQNERFNQIVNLHHYSSINYYKAERHIMKVLEQRLSKNLHYHSIAHTKDVVTAVERLALLENVTDEGLFLLKSAATYHDAGFVEEYDNNEPIGARLADEILPKYGYTEKHIERIKELIYVTEIPHEPKNQLEEIICDADLDYLGRDDFHEIADRLRRELKEHGKIESDKQWDEIQVGFLTSHKYFTKTAQKTRKKKKMQNLKEVKARLKENNYKE